ncbi:unnamed protein product, partial [Mesorhabditis belari]|uniref:Uncharacterized protein n=1 Tax=Mesorhabditis belari TaxID=2138241 RepID=A0AAF3FPG4_9BILA
MVMQVFSMALDLVFHGFVPELYTPAFVLKSYGILYEVFHINAFMLYELGGACAWGIVFGTILCFLYRHQLVLPQGHWARFRSSSWAIFLLSHTIYVGFHMWAVYAIPFQHPPNASGLPTVLKNYPDLVWIQSDADVWIGNSAAPLAPPYLNIQCGQGIILIFQMFYFLKNATSYMSERMRALNRRFINALLIQVGVPALTIAFPSFIKGIISRMGNPISQEFINLTLLCAMLHGKLTSILIIALIQPYRQYCVHKLWKIIGLTKPDITIVTSKTG